MSNDKFKAIDEAIITEIAMMPGCATFASIWPKVSKVAEATDSKDATRLVDRRLQALRKSGKLSYTRKEGWIVATW